MVRPCGNASSSTGESAPKAAMKPASMRFTSAGMMSARKLSLASLAALRPLIPTFLMIALHGHGDQATRRAVAWKITVYLGLGSLVLLAGLAALCLIFIIMLLLGYFYVKALTANTHKAHTA